MKNDFDFIRDKFSSDGVTAPGDINESLVLEKVKDTEPLKVKKSKKKIIGIASAAVAGVAVITAAGIRRNARIGFRHRQADAHEQQG